MSIAFGSIVSFAFRGLNLLVALATVLYLAHAMEDAETGLLVLGLTVIGLANALTGGLTAATAVQIANRKETPATALLNGAVSAATVGVVAIAAGLIVANVASGDPARVAMQVGLAAAAVVVNGVIAGVFLGRESIVRYNIALVLPPALSFAVLVVAVSGLGHDSGPAGLTAYAIGQWLATGALLILAGRAIVRGGRFDGTIRRGIVRFAAVAALASGISYLNYRADQFVVEHFEGTAGVASYARAVYLAESVWQVSGSLALASYARLGGLTRPEAAELTGRVMRHTLALLAVICIVLFVLADPLERYAFNGSPDMALALRFLLPGVLAYSLAQAYSGFYTYQRNMPWVSAAVAGTGLTIDLIAAVILVPRMGIAGAGLASTIAYTTCMIGALIVFLRSERLGAAHVLVFGRRELQDYRTLIGRVRSAVGR